MQNRRCYYVILMFANVCYVDPALIQDVSDMSGDASQDASTPEIMGQNLLRGDPDTRHFACLGKVARRFRRKHEPGR